MKRDIGKSQRGPINRLTAINRHLRMAGLCCSSALSTNRDKSAPMDGWIMLLIYIFELTN